jgi:hypothetical protein
MGLTPFTWGNGYADGFSEREASRPVWKLEGLVYRCLEDHKVNTKLKQTGVKLAFIARTSVTDASHEQRIKNDHEKGQDEVSHKFKTTINKRDLVTNRGT